MAISLLAKIVKLSTRQRDTKKTLLIKQKEKLEQNMTKRGTESSLVDIKSFANADYVANLSQ
nr:MAG: hypothetical protein [Bacteriophage sp.]